MAVNPKTTLYAAFICSTGVSADYCNFGYYDTRYCEDGCCYSDNDCCSKSNAALWGALAGVFAFVIIIVAITVYCCKRRQSNAGVVRSAQPSTFSNGPVVTAPNYPVTSSSQIPQVNQVYVVPQHNGQTNQVHNVPRHNTQANHVVPQYNAPNFGYGNQTLASTHHGNALQQPSRPHLNVYGGRVLATPAPIINPSRFRNRNPAMQQQRSADQTLVEETINGGTEDAVAGFMGGETNETGINNSGQEMNFGIVDSSATVPSFGGLDVGGQGTFGGMDMGVMATNFGTMDTGGLGTDFGTMDSVGMGTDFGGMSYEY